MKSITISLVEELTDTSYIPHSAYVDHMEALSWVREYNKFINKLPKYRIRRVPLFDKEIK